MCGGEVRVTEADTVAAAGQQKAGVVVTNVAQFRTLPGEVFLGRCAFQLCGIVTLVDTNRGLLVLQDETGAVALNPQTRVRDLGVQAGQRVALAGERCFPYVVGFPAFPYRPSGSEVRPSFEAPVNWGDYYLTRMRGWLRPPVTGEYTFWLASDNSSELWLSTNEDPTRVKKLAFLPRYGWVAPREWARYPSQRSEQVHLQAGRAYYIEALQEQTTGNSHLAVAWQGPSVNQTAIDGNHLTPWGKAQEMVTGAATNGIRREYWTNFSLGGLATFAGPKAFESALSVDGLRVTRPGAAAAWPVPQPIALDRTLAPTNNYQWVEVQGRVTFSGGDSAGGCLELSAGQSRIQVRVLGSDAAPLRRLREADIRVEGVCEGSHDSEGVLFPGLIWVPEPARISVIGSAMASPASLADTSSASAALPGGSSTMLGYYGTRGVVTFNDRVFNRPVMFVQEGGSVISISLTNRAFQNEFEVGRWVELGGALQPGRNIPVLNPMNVMQHGWHAMPEPLTPPVQSPVPAHRDGRWTEAEGVVRAVNTNGTLTMLGGGDPLAVWIGKAPSAALSRYVDARLRVRGVLSLTIQETPLLLVPSASFVDVEKEAPIDPFSIPLRAVADVLDSEWEEAMPHRVRLVGTITLNARRRLFVQDATGGARVLPVENCELKAGQAVEVVGFPGAGNAVLTLSEALVRSASTALEIAPQKLDAGKGISFKHAGALVQVSAQLIAQRTRDGSQVLELQEKQRVFEAELPPGQPGLPFFAPGSRLRLCGVCDFAATALASSGTAATQSPSTGALKVWLRSPADVGLVSGPPWWSWKHTFVLVGALLTVLGVALLWIHLLRRRLERHLAFSRQILESQEIERHRIAANLHDSLGQNLLVIKNQARLAMQPAPDEAVLRQRLDQISGCASQAIEEVREITHALRPYQLDRLGLTQAVRANVNRAAESSSILFASHADDVDGLFDKESEIHVYRIVQEAVNNILKHSAATEATVVVKKLAAAVSLSIRDNGRGFDTAATLNANSHDVGHGISGIKERVRILGGTFALDSHPGQGTSLRIELPIPTRRHEAP